MVQGELFPDPRPAVPPRMRLPPPPVSLARYTGRRRPCDGCIRAIHLHGFAIAEPLMPARWRLAYPAGRIEHLCHQHKEQRLEEHSD